MPKKFPLKIFARFSEDVYKIPSAYPFETLTSGWRVFKDMDPEYQVRNTYARAYINANTDECDVIVSFRGTELKSAFNWMTNFDIFLLSNIPVAFSDSVLPFFEKLKTQIKTDVEDLYRVTCNYHFTGHSLGAGLAEISSVQFHYPATTFDSPGINDYVLTRIEEGQLSQNDLTYGQNNIFSVLSVPNLVNTARKHLGNFVSLNHDNADMIIPNNIKYFNYISFGSGYTGEYSHRMDLISSMIKEGAEMPVIYSSFANWPVTIKKGSELFTEDYTGFQYFKSYNHNPYYFEKLFFKWSDSPDYDSLGYINNGALDTAIKCRFEVINTETSIDARECLVRGEYSDITDVSPSITIYGDDSGVRFTGGTNFDNRYYGGRGDDIYYCFYGDDFISDKGGSNIYQFLPQIRGRKIIQDNGGKNGVIRVGNLDVTGHVKFVNKQVSFNGIINDFQTVSEGYIFFDNYKKYVKLETSELPTKLRKLLSKDDSSKILKISTESSKNPRGETSISNFKSGDFGIDIEYGNFEIFTFYREQKDLSDVIFVTHNGGAYDPLYDAIYIMDLHFIEEHSHDVINLGCTISISNGVSYVKEFQKSLRYKNSEGQFIIADEGGFYISDDNYIKLCKVHLSDSANIINNGIRGHSAINYYLDYNLNEVGWRTMAFINKVVLCESSKKYFFDDFKNGDFEASIDILNNGDIIAFISKRVSRKVIDETGDEREREYKTEFYYKILDKDLNLIADNILLDEFFDDDQSIIQETIAFKKITFGFNDLNIGYIIYYSYDPYGYEDSETYKIANFDIYNGIVNNRFVLDEFNNRYRINHWMVVSKFIFNPETTKFYVVSNEYPRVDDVGELIYRIKKIDISKIDGKTGKVEIETIYQSNENLFLTMSISTFKEKYIAITFFESDNGYLYGKTIFYNTDDTKTIESPYDIIQGNADRASSFGCRDSVKKLCIAVSNGQPDTLNAQIGRSSVLFGSESATNKFVIHPRQSDHLLYSAEEFSAAEASGFFARAKNLLSHIFSEIREMFFYDSKSPKTKSIAKLLQLSDDSGLNDERGDITISYFDNQDILDISPLIHSGNNHFQLVNNGTMSEIIFPNGQVLRINPSINTPPFTLNISKDGTLRAETIFNFTEFTPTRDNFDLSSNNSSNNSTPTDDIPSPAYQDGLNNSSFGAFPIISICLGVVGLLSIIFYCGYKKFGLNCNFFNNYNSVHDNSDNAPIERGDDSLNPMVELSGDSTSYVAFEDSA